MNIHEYQAKEILKGYGVPVPRGEVASTPEEAKAAAIRLGGGTCVVKAQIHAGGRGKGGGVKLASNPEEAEQRAREMIGKNLITH
jgi:succinyl-CoA synthetase beta subunit